MQRTRSLTTQSLRAFGRSIRFRLMLWSVAVLAVVLVLFCGVVYTRQAQDLRGATLTRLAVKTDQLGALLSYGSWQSYATAPLPFSDRTATGTSILQEDEVLALVASQGQTVQKLGPITDRDIDSLVAQAEASVSQSGLRPVQLEGELPAGGGPHEDYVVMLTPASSHGQLVGWLILGRPLDAEGQLPRLLVTLVFASLATLFIAAAGGYWLAGRAMRPVQIITRAARGIGETDLSKRLNLRTGDELGELASTFDQMLDRLQAAFQRQRQFTADASHELRTPLTIVCLEASRALDSTRSPQEYQRALQVIQAENEFMVRLVNDLLTLARMDGEQAVMQWETVDVSDVALEAVERVAPFAVSKKVELSTGDLPELLVRGDRQYLQQMVSNLVENAIKYSAGEGRHVRVATGRRERQAWVRVVDDGPGIAPEHLPHLFQRFYRVDQARSRAPSDPAEGGDGSLPSSGSGLGLAIVQRIAGVHGGAVTVQSEVGKGSVFEVSLPLLA